MLQYLFNQVLAARSRLRRRNFLAHVAPAHAGHVAPLAGAAVAPGGQGPELSLQTAVQNAVGSSSVGSTYRPPAYQAHLRAVWDKWRRLTKSDNPDCAPLREKIAKHKEKHKLIRRPVNASYHSMGEAFDITIGALPNWQVEVLPVGCGVFAPDPVGDPVHYLHTDRAGN